MNATLSTRLTVETAVYESRKVEWLKKHSNRFVVIKGETPLGFFDDFHQAYKAGVEKFGSNTDFLVKRIVAQEPVFVVF